MTEHRVNTDYRGRLAPSPTGLLHLGHARTFWTAWQRAREADGVLVLRSEDLDPQRSRPEFARAMIEDLHWLGIDWEEGPDVGGAFGPYIQSERRDRHRDLLIRLIAAGHVYACTCSRQDIRSAITAPHAADDEPVYPRTCRGHRVVGTPESAARLAPGSWGIPSGTRFSLRFQVPDGRNISFTDLAMGPRSYTAGRDLGDFVVWRHDDVPAYQLAVVADDLAMKITEVVRGEDLLVSTARQLLIYEASGSRAPEFYHCPLIVDANGERLSKRTDSLSIRALRDAGQSPAEIRTMWKT